MKRRDFLKTAALTPAALLALQTGCRQNTSTTRRVIVLGLDGMDPGLVRAFVNDGVMPNTQRLIAMGGLSSLRTSNPPQSPVAWSNFITGFGSEVHGIFDFIHRDPQTLQPFLSTSRVVAPGRTLSIGDWRLPLSGASVELLRKGEPFWRTLTDAGIPVTLVKLPVDFPPGEGKAKILSGLGTPDMRGSQGSFTFFTDDARSITDDSAGGVVVPVRNYGDSCYRCKIRGPENSMRAGNPDMEIIADVWADHDADAVRIDIQGTSHILSAGEWSPWIRLKFEAIPNISSVYAIGRFYLKQLSPKLKLYLSPLNIDPGNPALPVSNPSSFSTDIERNIGPFYTQGFPEDTKALSRGILDDEEYLQQAEIVLNERFNLLHHELSRFKEGLLFFYFSSLDLNVHMFYRAIDPSSPLYSSTDPVFRNTIKELYSKVDEAIGLALDAMDERTELIVLSDHGFAPFNRTFNLNTWLAESGYAHITSHHDRDRDMFAAISWKTTAAYGLGLNSLFINKLGRENNGIIPEADAPGILANIKRDLEAVTDPATGDRVIRQAYIVSELFPGPLPDYAPDMIIGYAHNYRASWETTLGAYPDEIIGDNLDPWSGTHCIDPDVVPGTFLSSISKHCSNPDLKDMGRSIASFFDIPHLPPGGRNIFDEKENQ